MTTITRMKHEPFCEAGCGTEVDFKGLTCFGCKQKLVATDMPIKADHFAFLDTLGNGKFMKTAIVLLALLLIALACSSAIKTHKRVEMIRLRAMNAIGGK